MSTTAYCEYCTKVILKGQKETIVAYSEGKKHFHAGCYHTYLASVGGKYMAGKMPHLGMKQKKIYTQMKDPQKINIGVLKFIQAKGLKTTVRPKDPHFDTFDDPEEKSKKPEPPPVQVQEGDYYSILGIEHSATQEEIKSAYRNQVKICHPDYGGDEEEFHRLQKAYSILKDPKKRKRYDLSRRIIAQQEEKKEEEEGEPIWPSIRNISPTGYTQTAAPSPPPPIVFKLGDIVEVKGLPPKHRLHSVTLKVINIIHSDLVEVQSQIPGDPAFTIPTSKLRLLKKYSSTPFNRSRPRTFNVGDFVVRKSDPKGDLLRICKVSGMIEIINTRTNQKKSIDPALLQKVHP